MDTRVYTAACPDYNRERIEREVKKIFDSFGGAEAMLKLGRRVLIKPNLLMARRPEGATTTHPELVRAVSELFCSLGAEVVIADSPGGPYNEPLLETVYKSSGMSLAAKETGARLNRDLTHQKVVFSGETRREFPILTPIVKSDIIINIAKMKTHVVTYFTGAVKNNFGAIPGLSKARTHSQLPGRQEFSRMLVDLCRCVSPTLSMIDGVVGMDGKGPSGGRARKAGVLIASRNPFAADLAAMHIAGLKPELCPTHEYAVHLGLVPDRYSLLEIMGEPVLPLEEPFIPAVRGTRSIPPINWLPPKLRFPIQRVLLPFPRITGRCVGCGACARACPGHALQVTDGKAVLERSKCIQCYCCHELCPIRAIDLK